MFFISNGNAPELGMCVEKCWGAEKIGKSRVINFPQFQQIIKYFSNMSAPNIKHIIMYERHTQWRGMISFSNWKNIEIN